MVKDPLTPALKKIPVTSKIRGYRYLVCQGGGMKGGGFGGAAEFLEATGTLSQFEAIAGSSAGAIFATLLAVGYTAKEIRAEMIALDFRRLQDKDSPGWWESTGIADLVKGFNPSDKKKGGLPVSVEEMMELLFGKKLGIWKGDALLSMVQRLIARKTGKPNLTFKELADLTKMSPGVFRNLILTGSNLTTKETEYYNAEDWPDMPIVDAVRISASFPGAFMPVTKPILKRREGAEGKPEYVTGVRVDGGLRENLPDIFNRPPYYTPTKEKPGNPQALALSFKEKTGPKDNKDQYESFYTYLKGLFSAAMSETDLRKKYEDNIAYIDTLGVGTLDFDAERALREALSDSGWQGLKTTFEKILEKENNPKLSQMSLDELLRNKACLLRDPDPTTKLTRLAKVNQHIKKRAAAERVSEAMLESRMNQELEKMDRFLLAVENREMVALSDEALVDSCQRKISELDNIKQEQMVQIKELRLLLTGLELRKVDFQSQIEKRHNKAWVERLESQLSVLNNLKSRLQELHLQSAEYQQELEKAKQDLKDKKITREGFNIEEARLREAERTVEMQIADIKNEKRTFINGVIVSYGRDKDDLMQCFFQEINEEFDKPEEDLKREEEGQFKMPEKAEGIIHFITRQQSIAEGHLALAGQKLKDTEEEIKSFKEKMHNFDKRSFAAKGYDTLKTLEKELERSIYEKTSFIAKINSYFVSDKPSFKNHLITGVMQFVAFTAFATRIALVAAGVAALAPITVPLFIYKIGQLVKNSNAEGRIKAAADKFLRAFGMPNLFKINKLRYLSRMTTEVVSVLDKNYSKADSSEHAYIHKLFQMYLKKSGLKFEDIFPMKEEDTRISYQALLEQFKNELEIEVPSFLREELDKHDPKFMKKFPIFKNFEAFHEKVKAKLLKTGFSLAMQPKQEVKTQAETQEAATPYRAAIQFSSLSGRGTEPQPDTEKPSDPKSPKFSKHKD